MPKYRGPSPVAYPLIFGEKETGVTLIKMDEKMDHGPIIVQEKIQISSTDKRPDLEIKLTELAFALFKRLILDMRRSSCNFSPHTKNQNHKLAVYTKLLKKDDGYVSFEVLKKALKNQPFNFEELPKILKEIRNLKLKIINSPEIIFNLFRGLYPWPGLWTQIPPTRWKWQRPKRLKITNLSLINNRLIIKKVQLEGKKEVEFETFNRAYQIF